MWILGALILVLLCYGAYVDALDDQEFIGWAAGEPPWRYLKDKP